MGSSHSTQRRSGRAKGHGHHPKAHARPPPKTRYSHAHPPPRPANAKPLNLAARPHPPPASAQRPPHARATAYGPPRPKNGKGYISAPQLVHSSTHGPFLNNHVPHRPPPPPHAMPTRRPVPGPTNKKAFMLPRLPFQSPSPSSSSLAPLSAIGATTKKGSSGPSFAFAPGYIPASWKASSSSHSHSHSAPSSSYPSRPVPSSHFPPLSAIGAPKTQCSGGHAQRILAPLPPLPLYSQHGPPRPVPVAPVAPPRRPAHLARSQSPFVPLPRVSDYTRGPPLSPQPRYPNHPSAYTMQSQHAQRLPSKALAPGYAAARYR